MNYSEITEILKDVSSFDLWRARCVISRMMEDPSKIRQVKMRLTPGMEVNYFDAKENRLIAATVLEVNRTRILVENKHDKERWAIPYYAVNLDNIDTDTSSHPERQGVSKVDLKVGDNVGWLSDREAGEMFGQVVKLNPKRAKVRRPNGEMWAVAYNQLFLVHEGDSNHVQPRRLIEGELV